MLFRPGALPFLLDSGWLSLDPSMSLLVPRSTCPSSLIGTRHPPAEVAPGGSRDIRAAYGLAGQTHSFSYPIIRFPMTKYEPWSLPPIMTGQICALREDDRNLNRVKQGIYLSDLNVCSLDSDGLESSGLSLDFVRDGGLLV